MNYDDFILAKASSDVESGFEPSNLGDHLFDFQSSIVDWACKRGRAAIFADTGLGKTAMQTEWARQVSEHTNGRVLIAAPLCGNLTPKPCLWHDKTTDHSRLSRFGMTCKILTGNHGEELLTSSAPARPSLCCAFSELQHTLASSKRYQINSYKRNEYAG